MTCFFDLLEFFCEGESGTSESSQNHILPISGILFQVGGIQGMGCYAVNPMVDAGPGDPFKFHLGRVHFSTGSSWVVIHL